MPDGHARHRDPPDRDHRRRRPSSARCSSTRCAIPVGQPGRRRERRLAGRHGHLRLRAGHRLRVRPGRDRPAARRAGRAGPADHPAGRRTAWDDVALRREIGHLQAEMDALWALTKRNLSQAARTGVPRSGRLGGQGRLLRARSSASPTWPCACSTAAASPWTTSATGRRRTSSRSGSARTSFTDRRRHQPDPAQHHRRAHPRPSEGADARGLRAERRAGRAWRDGRARLLRPARFPIGGRARRLADAGRRRPRPSGGELADLGVFSLAAPEADGGVGLGWADAVARLRGARPGRWCPVRWSGPTCLRRPRRRARPTGDVVVGGVERDDPSGSSSTSTALDVLAGARRRRRRCVDPRRCRVSRSPTSARPADAGGASSRALPQGDERSATDEAADAAARTARCSPPRRRLGVGRGRRPTWPWPTPRSASSSAGRSAPSRRSST